MQNASLHQKKIQAIEQGEQSDEQDDFFVRTIDVHKVKKDKWTENEHQEHYI